jgi:hypothetical protein
MLLLRNFRRWQTAVACVALQTSTTHHLHMLQTDAPYSAVYRPAESMDALVRGNGTLAGKGGSEGVWTLSVVDAREGDR